MIARRIRLVAGFAAACLLSSGAAVAADEDAGNKTPDRVTEQEVEDMREDAVETGTVLPRESWTSGQSTGHARALLDQDGPLTEQQAEVLREQADALQKEADALQVQAEKLRARADNRGAQPKGAPTSGESTGHEPATVDSEEANDNSKNKDDE